MSGPVDNLVDIIRDDLNACPDRDLVRSYQTIGDSYDALPVGRPGGSGASLWWWIESFLTDPQERARVSHALQAVDAFFVDLEKLTGPRNNARMREGLKRRILHHMFPSPKEIVEEALNGPALRAQANLLRYIEDDAWRMRS